MVFFPLSDAPAYEKPGKPVNVTVVAVNGGWVIRYARKRNDDI
jgi:hypothetical protein